MAELVLAHLAVQVAYIPETTCERMFAGEETHGHDAVKHAESTKKTLFICSKTATACHNSYGTHSVWLGWFGATEVMFRSTLTANSDAADCFLLEAPYCLLHH